MGDIASDTRATGAALAPAHASYYWHWRFS
jgi:hypothetical protein